MRSPFAAKQRAVRPLRRTRLRGRAHNCEPRRANCELLSAVVTVALGLITLNVVGNVLYAPVLSRYHPRPGARRPRVSLLVPARDEAASIGPCLTTLLAQDYPDLEILVLDDGSTDGTAAIVMELAAAHPRLRLLVGAPPPAGWLGKHYACWQLAGAAAGELLVFLDADVRLAPPTVGHLVAALGASGADLLTVLPRQEVVSLGERLTVPLVYASIICLLPLPLVPRRPEPSLAMGNGQLMCFRAEAYARLGGHAAVRDRVLDDVELARRTKRAGGRLLVADGGDLVACRMYRSWGEAWRGFSKNLYAFFGATPPGLALGLTVALVLYLLPWLVLPLALLLRARRALVALSAVQVGLILTQRLLISLRFRYPVPDVLLHPLAMLTLLAITLNSARLHHAGAGAAWKGRATRVMREP